MTLIVTTPAATTALTTVDAVKTELDITDGSQDAYLETQINRASALICSYLCVHEADDATVTLGRETLLETIDPQPHGRVLYPSRRPIVSVASITEGATVADPANYKVSAAKIVRVQNSLALDYWWTSWFDQSVVIAYVAGWLLPGDEGRNLPLEIEMACIDMVKEARFNRNRDLSLRSETTEGVDSYTLFDRSKAETVIPQSIAVTIERYRIPYV